ncbi:MAG: glycosyltransferase [Proteobacteria bacterium]|nr:glycosyltransferase [Pseudomonadota bacterium]
MKIVQFIPNLNSGGVERGTLEIASALVAAGHESHVVSNGGRLVEELEAAGSTHHCWPLQRKSPTTLLQVSALRRWLCQLQPDVLHVRSRMPAWVVWLAWRKMNRRTRPRLVSTLHGLHSVSWYSKIMGRGERVIAVSQTARNYLLEHCNVPATNIRVIYRGTADDDFPRGYTADSAWHARWQESFPQLQGKRLICLPGRLSRHKGHHHLVALIKGLKERGISDVAGVIVGGIDAAHKAYVAGLKTQIETAGLTDDIIFTGHRSDMRDIYAACAVVLAVSNTAESFGRTALEPLCIGTPVVGFDLGGVGEILAALFPAGRVAYQDSAALLSTLAEVLADPAPAIAPNSEFLLSSMCAQTLQLYEELVAERLHNTAAPT